jgi:acetoacetate decarboxylase
MLVMKIDEIRRSAYAMPLTNPAFPRGPYRFFDREYLIVSYRTDLSALRAVVPEPLEVSEPIVKYEFIRMPDSTGFGDYTESGQMIPVRLNGEEGAYVHSMYLDDDAPILGGRELWGFPKKLAQPKISHEGEVIVCTLRYGQALCAMATMGYKHCAVDRCTVLDMMRRPNFVLKIIPHVDATPRICELVRYQFEDIEIKQAWSAPADLELFRHVVADVARLPVIEVVSGLHFVANMTLGLGTVVFDYLADAPKVTVPLTSDARRAHSLVPG